MIKVRVSELGGVFKEVELEEGATVRQALEAAGAKIDVAKTIKINADEEPAELDDIVENGDSVCVVPHIKGNKQ